MGLWSKKKMETKTFENEQNEEEAKNEEPKKKIKEDSKPVQGVELKHFPIRLLIEIDENHNVKIMKV